MCYRFMLSNPPVHVCLRALSNRERLQENLRAVAEGPLLEEEMVFMSAFGETVRQRTCWFMQRRGAGRGAWRG